MISEDEAKREWAKANAAAPNTFMKKSGLGAVLFLFAHGLIAIPIGIVVGANWPWEGHERLPLYVGFGGGALVARLVFMGLRRLAGDLWPSWATFEGVEFSTDFD